MIVPMISRFFGGYNIFSHNSYLLTMFCDGIAPFRAGQPFITRQWLRVSVFRSACQFGMAWHAMRESTVSGPMILSGRHDIAMIRTPYDLILFSCEDHISFLTKKIDARDHIHHYIQVTVGLEHDFDITIANQPLRASGVILPSNTRHKLYGAKNGNGICWSIRNRFSARC